MDGDPSEHADRFLTKTIQVSPSDLYWLFNERRISAQRKASLLNAVLLNTSDADLKSAVSDASLSGQIEAVLSEDLMSTAPQLARVLIVASGSAERLLRSSHRILPLLQDRTLKSDLVLRSLTVGLSAASTHDNAVISALLAKSAGLLDAHRLVALAIPHNASAQRVSDNVVLLDMSAPAIRRGVLSEIEELSDRLIARHARDLSHELVSSWAHLLADSGESSGQAQLNAAGKVLSFALGALREPVSPLIVVSFPIVYAQLRSGKETPNLFSFIFTDWDRCKTVRNDIVQAFVRSDWPPTDLIRAVEPTGDLRKTLRRLFRDHDGEAFLGNLRLALRDLPAREQKQLHAVIAEALESVRSEGG